MTDIVWPEILRPKSVSFYPDAPSRSGGPSTSGVERIVASGSVRWKATLDFMVWGSPSQPEMVLAWRAIQAQALGRVGQIIIGPHDWLTPARIDGRSTILVTNHSDGSPYSDGTPHRQTTSTAIVATDAVLRSSTLDCVPVEGFEPRAGQYFGVGYDRLHLIGKAVRATGGAWTLSFQPPLRAPLSAGAELDFENPRCRMRLATDDSALLKLTVPWLGEPSLDLVEIY